MKDNKNYDYTDEFSSMVHSARFINAAELSGLFFSAPKWITIWMKFRNVMVKPLGLKKERDLWDLVHIESENIATVCKNDKHLDLEIAFITARKIRLKSLRKRMIFSMIPHGNHSFCPV